MCHMLPDSILAHLTDRYWDAQACAFLTQLLRRWNLKTGTQMIKITQLKKRQGPANVCKHEDCLSYPTLTKSDVCRVFFLLIAAQHNLSSDDGSMTNTW